MTKPLAGTLVLSLDQAVAAPMTSRKLADAGARVIKLERPEGDFARAYDSLVNGLCTHFVWLNRGKEFGRRRPHQAGRQAPVRGDRGQGRRARAEPEARRPGQARLSYGSPARAVSAPHLLLDLGLRRRRALSRPQGLRPADPGGVGAGLRHRRTRGAGARGRIGGRHLHGHERLRGDPGGADRALRHGQGRRHPRLHVRLDDGVDGGADALHGVRHAAQAHRLEPSRARALRRVHDRRRGADSDLHPERPRVGDVRGQGAG